MKSKCGINVLSYVLKLLKYLFTSNRNHKAPIVVLSFKNYGDTVFTIPALNHLIDSNFKSTLYIFCFEGADYLYKTQFKKVDYRVYTRKEVKLQNPFPPISLITEIKKIKPYAVINLTGGLSSSLITLFSFSRIKIGFGNQLLSGLYDHYFPYHSFPHLMDLYGKTVELFTQQTVDTYHQDFQVHYKKDDKILINPFAGWNAKVWGIRKFIELGENLNREFSVSFIAKTGEFDDDTIDYLKDRKLKILLTNTIPELVNEILNCSLFIGNDSGPLNIASLYGKPTFTVYGPTNPEFSKPKNNLHRCIRKKIHCSPKNGEQYCHTLGGQYCPFYKCMELLTLHEVMSELVDFINYLGIEKK